MTGYNLQLSKLHLHSSHPFSQIRATGLINRYILTELHDRYHCGVEYEYPSEAPDMA